jgi:phosphate butyryltransferase
MITSFDEIKQIIKKLPKKRIALANAVEPASLSALADAHQRGIAEPVLVGNEKEIRENADTAAIDIDGFTIIHEEGEDKICQRTVQTIINGEADLLMKGNVATAALLRPVLMRSNGIRKRSALAHVQIVEAPTYHKLLVMADAGVNISPDLSTKIQIVENCLDVSRSFRISIPKVAVITAVEKVNPDNMPATVDAAVLSKMSERGQIENCIIEGPYALDNAISKLSCKIKGIETEVGGDADILIMPDIEAANVFYKTITYLTNYKTAGLIMGASVPLIIPSRADSDSTKYLSILTAIFLT